MATSGWTPDTTPDVLFSARNGQPAITAPADDRQRFTAFPLREIRIDGLSRRLQPKDACGWISPVREVTASELVKLIMGCHVRVADLVTGQAKGAKAGAESVPDMEGAGWLALTTIRDVRSRWSNRGLIPAETIVGFIHPGDVLSNQQIKTLADKNLLRFDIVTAQTATI